MKVSGSSVLHAPSEQVWRAITDSATLAEWMFPNDFEPRVGHRFTFRVPGNPKVNFDGLVVRHQPAGHNVGATVGRPT